VWQSLAEPHAAAFVRSVPRAARTAEAVALHRDLEVRFAMLEATPAAPPAAAAKPAQDLLPSKLRSRIKAAISRSNAAAHAPAHPAASAAAASAAPSQGAPVEAAKAHGLAHSCGRVLDYTAWAVILGLATLALSSDGLGLLSFHAVPAVWRPAVRSFLGDRALQVEELLANQEMLEDPGAATDGIAWALQSYIQVPGGRGSSDGTA